MKKMTTYICFILMLTLLSGCFLMPVDEPPPPPLTVNISPEHGFFTVPVERGDIMREITAPASYTPSRRVHHSFPVDGVLILGIFVNVGQLVLEGDIIAELDVKKLEDEYNELTRMRELAGLELKQLEERQAILRRQATNAGIRLDNSSFLWSRDTLRLNIAYLDSVIEHVEQMIVDRNLYAAIDGVVTRAMIYYEGMLSDSNSIVATVSNDLVSSFVITGDVAESMKLGDRFEMSIGDEEHLMEVIDPDEYGIDVNIQPPYAFLTFVNTPPETIPETTGVVHIPLGKVNNVLYIPVSVLRRTNERTFVYVLDNNGLRSVRDVVTGFEGDGYIEIVSGLSEGEQVVR